MSAWIAGTAAVIGVTSLASGIMGAKAAAKEADRKRAAEMDAAEAKFSILQSNVNLQKEVSREQTLNAQREVLRAGAAQNREIKQEVQKATSTSLAQSDGLTSGNSKGREMVSLTMKGAKAVQKSKTQASNQISLLADRQNKMTNDLNAKLIGAHQELAGVLSTPGAIFQQNVAALVGSTVSGAAQGASLGMGLKNS